MAGSAEGESGTNALQKSSIWSPTFTALLLANFFNSMGQATTGAVLPLYVKYLGAATSVIGFVAGAFAITALAIRPFAGPAFDSFPKKRILLGSLAVISISMLLYSLAQSVPMIIVTRLLHGVGMGCAAPVALSIVSSTLPPARLNSGISVYTLSQAAAQAVGPAFGIWFSRTAGYSPTFLLTAASIAISLALIAVLVREPDAPEGGRPAYQLSLKRAFALRAMGPACLIMLLSMSFSCVGSFMAIYGELRGVEEIGLYFTVYALCLLVTRPVLGRLSDRVGTTRVLVPAAACFAVSFILISRADSLASFLISAVVAAFGFGVCMPLMQALVFRCVPSQSRGSASNTSYMGLDIGSLVGPYLGGAIIEALVPIAGSEVAAYSMMWLVMIAPIVAGVVFYLAMRGRFARYAREASGDTGSNQMGT